MSDRAPDTYCFVQTIPSHLEIPPVKISHPYPDSLPAEMGPLSPRDPSAPKVEMEYSPEFGIWCALVSMGSMKYRFVYRTREEFIDGLGRAAEALRQGFAGQGPKVADVSPRPGKPA